jgi:hypothetical protein
VALPTGTRASPAAGGRRLPNTSAPVEGSVRASALLVLSLTLAVVLTVGVESGRSHTGPPARQPVSHRPAQPPAPQAGWATFYADAFQGRPMADGRTFDLHDPHIAASNRWPLGTRLRIRRLPGGPWQSALSQAELQSYLSRTVVVTVEDRGAFSHALDLSAAAFAELGRPEEGVIPVSIEPLPAPAGTAAP